MKTGQNKLEDLKGKRSFAVPEGYFENLTGVIMDQLPEKEIEEEVPSVTWMDQIRPWLYLAAVFVGLGLFFDLLIGSDKKQEEATPLLVTTEPASHTVVRIDDEYYEYLEEEYAGYLLASKIEELE